MNLWTEAVHILLKDIRRQTIDIGLMILAVVVYGTLATSTPSTAGPGFQLPFVDPFAWPLIAALIVIVRCIQAEPLPGDNHFWLTRPYRHLSLVLAKALFIAASVNAPFLVADLLVAQHYHFNPISEIGAILWRQALLVLLFIAPVAAIATVTRTFVHAFLTIVGVIIANFVAMLLLLRSSPPFGLFRFSWIETYIAAAILAVGAAVAICWQYSRRDTKISSGVLALLTLPIALLAVSLVPFTAKYAVQTRLAQSDHFGELKLAFTSDLQWAVRAVLFEDGSAEVYIPFKISGAEPNIKPRVEAVRFRIGDDKPRWAGLVKPGDDMGWMRSHLDSRKYQQIRSGKSPILATAFLTVWGNRRDTQLPVTNRYVQVPGFGVCSASNGIFCVTAFRPPARLVSFQSGDFEAKQFFSYSPFPAEVVLSPVQLVTSLGMDKADAAIVSTLEPVAYIQRDITINDLKLENYESKAIGR